MENQLSLRGIIGIQILDSEVSAFLQSQNNAPIEVRMHSFGGSVFEGNLIYNSFRRYEGKKTLIIEGVCASMGSIILGSFDEVFIVQNGFVMIHTPSGFTEGNASAHESSAKVLRSMEKNFKSVYRQRTEFPLDSLMDGNDHWFDAEEALANGFVDGILEEVGTYDFPNLQAQAKLTVADILPYYQSAQSQFQSQEIHTQTETLLSETDSTRHSKIITQNSNRMNKKIMSMLLNMGATLQLDATEDQVADSLQAKFKEKDEEITRLNALLKKQAEEAKKAVLNNALQSGRINQEQFKNLSEVAEKLESVEDVQKLIAGSVGQVSISALLRETANKTNTTPIGRETWDWDMYQDKDPNALDRMRTEEPERYAVLEKQKFSS